MQNLNDHLEEVEKKIAYQFKNKDLLRQAFTRSSYSAQYGSENNEVLEFLGDKILDFYVVKMIAEEFGFFKSQSEYYDNEEDADEFCIVAHKRESDFTDLKKEIVSNRTLSKRIDEFDFAKYMRMGDCDIDNHVERQEKVKADLFEAILGAIAIDCNWNQRKLESKIAKLLQIETFFEDVDVEEERPDKYKLENAVSTLKEYADKGRCSIAEYDCPNCQVEQDGKFWWSCVCFVKSWGIRKTALATSKKEAKKYAAYLVLCERFKIIDEFKEE